VAAWTNLSTNYPPLPGLPTFFAMKFTHLLAGLVILGLSASVVGDAWPQWLGPQRDGIYRETGLLKKFPETGLKVQWRKEVNAGYCGPAISDGRLYMMDRVAGKMPERKRGDRSIPEVPGNERLLCLDTATGATVWEQSYERGYRIDYPAGPRATPVIADNKIYTLGAMGDLRCHSAKDGAVIWALNFMTNYQADPPMWGWAAHPLIEGERLITLVGGTNSAVVAFHKDTGKEIWRALTAHEVGYAPPMLYTIAGKSQLIVWHPDAVTALNPVDGKTLWAQKYPVDGKAQRPGVTISTPRTDGSKLFITEFYQGALMLDLSKPGDPVIAWNRHGKPGVNNDDGLHSVMSTPFWKDGFIYGVCGFGEVRCLDATSGDRRWESLEVVGGKKGLFANAFLIPHEDRTFIWNDQGELILAKLTPEKYEEISRAKLLSPIENTRGRDVLWCHPAFAERSMFVHNGKELIRVSLAESN
jgi:outer membrane protein assembly factor BamB